MADTNDPGVRPSPALLWATAGLKVALLALVAFALTHLGWERFADKAMTARAVLYPAAAALVPAVWVISRRRSAYPALVDLLVTTPFVVDLLGNALDLYDRVSWFDDACHLVNWGILTGAVAVPLARRAFPWWVTFGLCAGFGAVTAILWEVGELGAFVLKTNESVTAYRDTVGDLALGLSGSAVAGALAAWRSRRA
ncbi:MAG TPA: hypothetical protein VFQ85_05870 [Mycobacteriales bacterium]|jgi:hypothetical protein|nr:hypothetical protein [Mycobacteriales bacterium]